MGGLGSGRIKTLSDEDKKRKGTFRPDESETALAAKAGAKVITGVFLPKVPDPSVPLNSVGKAKYDELTRLLFEQNKLTVVTCDDCQRYAVMHQQMHDRLTAGKSVSMDLIKRMDAISIRLRIAENAPTIASPGAKNKFEGAGFSNSRSKAYRLRPYTSSDSGEL